MARTLAGRVAHMRAVNPSTEPQQVSPGETQSEPPEEEEMLPSQNFFVGLQWDTLMKLKGQTFVQVPRRWEQAFCDAVRAALTQIVSSEPQSQDALIGWKALIVLPCLLMLKQDSRGETESCANILTE